MSFSDDVQVVDMVAVGNKRPIVTKERGEGGKGVQTPKEGAFPVDHRRVAQAVRVSTASLLLARQRGLYLSEEVQSSRGDQRTPIFWCGIPYMVRAPERSME